MALRDALAKAADMPLAVFLGSTLGAVPADNSNGPCLSPRNQLGTEAAAPVAEGDSTALESRLGRDIAWDEKAIARFIVQPWRRPRVERAPTRRTRQLPLLRRDDSKVRCESRMRGRIDRTELDDGARGVVAEVVPTLPVA